jgi:hypothetical protein
VRHTALLIIYYGWREAKADDRGTSLRDKFVKQDGAWLFAERVLYVDWIEERILS